MRHTHTKLALTTALWITSVCGWTGSAAQEAGEKAAACDHRCAQKFFGVENVNPGTATFRRDRVIFSWITNAWLMRPRSEAESFCSTRYINRFEVPPGSGPDLRRTPFGAQDLVDLHPERFLSVHGHGDHADNAAYIAEVAEYPDLHDARDLRCDAAGCGEDGGRRPTPSMEAANSSPMPSRSTASASCRAARSGHCGGEYRPVNPVACIVAFKHIHSGRVPPDPQFWGSNPIVPVINDSIRARPRCIPREPALRPSRPRPRWSRPRRRRK